MTESFVYVPVKISDVRALELWASLPDDCWDDKGFDYSELCDIQVDAYDAAKNIAEAASKAAKAKAACIHQSPGTRIQLLKAFKNLENIPAGEFGTIEGTDSCNQILVRFDSGKYMVLNPETDSWALAE